jgi:hypothetical protein
MLTRVRGALRSPDPDADSARPLTFVIACLGRVGSQHLVSLLDSHPDIRCFGELFNPAGSVYAKERRGDHHEYLREVAAEVEAAQIGCKLTWPTLHNFPNVLDLFHDPNLRIIRLVRPNYLQVHISVLHATKTGMMHSTERSHGDAMTVRVEAERCYQDLFGFFVADRFLDELTRHSPVFRIEHHQLADEAVLADLQRFLGVEPAVLTSPHKKLVSRPLADAIENFDEVVAMLEGTPWASFVASST